MKKCPRCKQWKELTEFYKNRTQPNGCHNWCKKCNKEYLKQYYIKNKEKIKQQHQKYEEKPETRELKKGYARKYRKIPEIREKIKCDNKKYREQYPLKIKTRRIIASAIRANKLKRRPCIICDEPDAEAHHENYTEPYQITWLCHKHHTRLHRGLIKMEEEK